MVTCAVVSRSAAEARADVVDGCYDSAVLVDSSVSPVDGACRDVEPRFVAQVTECRANPVVSRRGYLLVTDSTDQSATLKRWVVSHPLIHCFYRATLC